MNDRHAMPLTDPLLPLLGAADLAPPTEEPARRDARTFVSATDGKLFWRSLDELADTPEFADYVKREFPQGIGEWNDPLERRRFLQLMAASLSFAGLGAAGCIRQPEEKLVPYVRQPDNFVPGRALEFATAFTLGGYATGVLVKSLLGRPTKIEGNPLHPASLGASDSFVQASILGLYDPDRSQTVVKGDRIATWAEFLTALTAQMTGVRTRQGAGFAILTPTVTSPTLGGRLRALLGELPQARWYQYEPAGRDNVRAGTRLAFGADADLVYHLDRADVILALDADFLTALPGSTRYAGEFAARRRDTANMNRLYALESIPTVTGSSADHRLALKAANIERAARKIAAALGVAGSNTTSTDDILPAKWVAAVAADLQAHRGRSLIIAGDGQPAAVHHLAHLMNAALGNFGTTVERIAPVEFEPTDQLASLRALTTELNAGRIDTLVVLGGNPAYEAPGELNFSAAYQKAKWRVHLSEYQDETSFLSHWHVPQTHYLEAWGDARSFDGTATIVQPLIAPLYSGKSPLEFLAAVAGRNDEVPLQLVKQTWRNGASTGTAAPADPEFERRWRKAVHDGLVPDSRSRTLTEPPTAGTVPSSGADSSTGLEVTFAPDPTVYDGRFANNGWLQELPKPLTKLTWENAALTSPRTAARLDVKNGDIVELRAGGRTLEVPIWITPGQPDDSLAVSMGYGRSLAGRIGSGIGANIHGFRPARPEWFVSGVELVKTGRSTRLAVTQNHYSMEGRDLIQVRTAAEAQSNSKPLDEHSRHPEHLPSLYPPVADSKTEEPISALSGNAWGLVIDQTSCIGCNACVTACQAENNVPIVGKEQILKTREMHWIRIDRYYRGDVNDPEAYFQPITCMHCEHAPCELVCPVAATVHSYEGLNQMVYNRCVGTRYCSNNCPYKVRRFNFLDYRGELGYETAPVLDMLRNPEVTVRSRGVMEKCTYCVQRIEHAKIEAGKENRPVRDGEITTACQQACPSRAIVFGNLRDPNSAVSKVRKSNLNYALLAELGTQPRTTYLAAVRNPNPALASLADFDTPTPDDPLLNEILRSTR